MVENTVADVKPDWDDSEEPNNMRTCPHCGSAIEYLLIESENKVEHDVYLDKWGELQIGSLGTEDVFEAEEYKCWKCRGVVATCLADAGQFLRG